MRAAWLGSTGTGTNSGDADPGYSALALSDAAADLTATQTWAVIDDEPPLGPSATPRSRRDWGSHVEETGPGRQRTADGPGGPGRGADRPGAARRDETGRGTTRLGAAGIGAAAGLGAAAGPRVASGGLAGAERTAPGIGAPDTDSGGLGGPDRRLGDPARALRGPDRGLGADDGERVLPDSRAARRQSAQWQAPAAFGEPDLRRRSSSVAPDETESDSEPAPAGRRSGKRGGRRRRVLMYGLLLAPVLIVILVVAGYVYINHRHAPATPHSTGSSDAPAASKSPAPKLGPWKHIESRSLDPAPLTVTELFPAKFSSKGQAGTLTVSKSGSKCSHEVFGTKLATAIGKADCTQVLRASYLSSDRKMMATVGVLNLETVSQAEKAGQAAGATEFIKQLPSAHGPTRNIAKGTGIVEADVKGHYLILTWTEFTNLHAPSGKSQRHKLEAFSAGLVAGTANVSLTNRMVTGHPVAASKS